MNSLQTPTFTATTAILPNSFFKLTGDFKAGLAGLGDAPFGITKSGTREAPIPGASANAAEIGDPIQGWGPGETAMIRVGAALTAGQYLKPDATGAAIPALPGDVYGAQCLRGNASIGSIAEVYVARGIVPPGAAVYVADGAIATSGNVAVLTKGSAGAYTLAAPIAAQEGMEITIVSQTAFAHVVTATGLINDGVTGGSKNTMTFAAFAGAAITLVANNLKWAVVSKNVVTVA